MWFPFFLKRETLDNIVRWAKTAGGYIFQCSAAIVPIRSLGRPYGRTIHNNSQARKILWIYIYIVYLFTDIFLLFVGFGNPVAWGRARSRSAQLGSAGRRGGRLRAAFRQPGAGNTAYSSKNCAQAQQSQIIKKNIGFSRCLSSQCRPGGRGLPNATQGTKKRVSQN